MKTKKISKPGEYNGYSEIIYSEVIRTSRYLYIRGNYLAIDIYRPAKDGVTIEEPYPAILQNKRFERRGTWTDVNLINEWVKHGYVVVVFDPRGAGASFGYRAGEQSPEEALDGKEVVEWLAAQTYCNGKVGMWGHSYMGGIQYYIASARPPHLVAITPEVTSLDLYFSCPNGVVWLTNKSPKSTAYSMDTRGTSAVPPQNVDEDPNGIMLQAAVAEHKNNIYSDQEWTSGQTYRNQYKPEIRAMNFIKQAAITYKDDIKASGVAIYNIGGWYDTAPIHALAAWKLWGGKVIIGPWSHNAMPDMVKVERLRWFDYHLQGIQNGVMDEPPIYYYTINAPSGKEWQFTSHWPLPEQMMTKYYFGDGPTRTSASINDGSLKTSIPTVPEPCDKYKVDYSIKVFEENGDDKYSAVERCWEGDMEKTTDSKGLTFTSSPLKSNMRITGTPVLHLWASSSSTDGYFFAFLEEVDGKTNKSHYITTGMIRAACRALAVQSPWTDLGMPYHRCYDVDSQPLVPGQPVELTFAFYPTSYIFRQGNRIRVTITCSLQSIYAGMIENPAPEICVYHNTLNASYIELPVISMAH